MTLNKSDAGHRLDWYPYLSMGVTQLDKSPLIKSLIAGVLDVTIMETALACWSWLGQGEMGTCLLRSAAESQVRVQYLKVSWCQAGKVGNCQRFFD